MKTKFCKVVSLLLAGVLMLSFFAGCGKGNGSSAESSGSSSQREPANINVAILKGPTALGMLGLMDKSDNGNAGNNYHFSTYTAPDQVVPEVIKGSIDIAAVPTNLAATLYQKTNGGVSMIAVNTLGVLSLLTNGESITEISQLRGKTIYATGKGATTEYVLNYLLEKNGLKVGTDVFVEYKAEHAELATLVVSGEVKLAVLPQPFVSSVTLKNKDVTVALDLSEEWKKLPDSNGELVMGCLVARRDFIDKNREALNVFLSEYKASTEQANDKLDVTAELAAHYEIMEKQAAAIALPGCNIVYRSGKEMKESAKAYLDVLYSANPASVGGALPKDDFYYEK